MRFCLPMLMAILVMCTQAYAQNISIRGIVTDEAKKPMTGVSVQVKGSTNGTSTRTDGSFAVNITGSNAILIITHSGYARKEVPVSSNNPLVQISLQPIAENMDEVVVISALGLTRKAKSVTYSSQSVDADRLTEARDVNIVNGLMGKVAGLQVTTTGQPGSSSRVVIRGEGSITGNNQPLWVVDGVPIANSISERNGLDYGNTAADLNPDDIESIEVLKGPNAAALYGSMAANGAILVTTKKGKPGDKSLGISVNQNMMWYTITEFPAYQNIYGEGGGGRLVGGANQLFPGTGAINMGTNERSWGAPMLGQPYNDFSGKPLPGGYSPQPGNVTDFYKSSLTNTSNIAISKSDAVSSFRLSYTYTKSDDVLQNQNMRNKHNLNLYATRKLGNKVTIDARLLYTMDDMKNRTYRNLNPSSPMAAYVYLARSANLSAFTPWKDANGNAPGLAAFGNTENPYWMLYENENRDSRNRYIGGVTTTIELAKGLRLRGQATGDIGTFSGYEYRELGSLKLKDGFFSNRMQDERNWNFEAMLQFNKKVGEDFSVTANAATNLATFNSVIREAWIDKLLVHDKPSILNANTTPKASEGIMKRQIGSVYGNATIGFRDLIYFDATARADKSSTLPKGSNTYFYPSVGLSFIFSQLLKNKDIISYGKLRGSWAKVGNSAPPNFLTTNWSNAGLFLGNPTFNYSTRLNNFTLKPEQTISREIGLELGLFKQRVNLTATIYQSNSTNQIITANTPNETGFQSRVVNAGEMRNKGIELTASVNVIRKKNFSWDLRANWSKNDNLVMSLVDGVPTLSLGNNLGATVSAVVGKPYGVITGTTPYYIGDTILVQANGRLYPDVNKYVGVYRPDWLGSIGSTMRYKAFDLSFLFNVKWGGSLYSASYGRANGQGNTIESLEGREEWFFSNFILGENGDERMGIGQQVGTVRVPYADGRQKGRRYALSYFPLLDANGNAVLDKNGRMTPGKPNTVWAEPQLLAGDYTLNNVNSITYDASAIRLTELVIGYTVPNKVFKNGFVKGVRAAMVGRNLWLLYRNTPRGIDPESANTSGNAQGIESGGSFPYAQYGFDVKVNF
ncbi:SusC/RagA family TonB-linked outer membrane protein [Paraflavitalea sp. CAU 1676]|uniref:SusC/RagA family TonB-linked outer membrane protein n=1 Tax=Paraflavitalea sp. CAU 1676 TaxID=3032598 RepID=UPI0023D9ABD5|nr:SusC/RagA family TonB-linked outer membrane protein [Paraflavitalea sp. CAU 1676]MDF2192396.1 SusC/RagA family TonB-linked outer membrane protein [Paraflavitalea sp. CAU 1676]